MGDGGVDGEVLESAVGEGMWWNAWLRSSVEGRWIEVDEFSGCSGGGLVGGLGGVLGGECVGVGW